MKREYYGLTWNSEAQGCLLLNAVLAAIIIELL